MFGGFHRRRHRVGRGRHLGHAADNQFLQPCLAEHGLHLRIERGHVECDEEVGTAVLDLVLQNRCGIEWRVVDHRAAGLQHREECNDVVRRIREVQADVHARLHAKLLQPTCGAIHVIAQLPIAQALAHKINRRPIGPLGDGIIENCLQWRRGDILIPAHTSGVGIDPGHIVHGIFVPV